MRVTLLVAQLVEALRWGRYLGLRGTRYQRSGENYITRSFMIHTGYQILLVWSNREEWETDRGSAYRVLMRRP